MEAQTTPRPRLTRPAPASRFLTLAPYNPYILPSDRSSRGWVFWGLRALGLSVAATLIWDRSPHIASSKGGFMMAPAQWVSAIVLVAAAVAGVFVLGAPWGALPLAAGAIIGLRRILAADGRALTLDAALAGATRKFVLAGAGIAVWCASVGLAGWLDGILGQFTKSPIGRMGGESAAQSLTGLSTAGERLIDWGSGACFVMIALAALWWARDAYLNQMDAASE